MQRKVNRLVAQCAFVRNQPPLHNMQMNLARIRELRGLTQRDLAEMIGMNAATIQRAEVGAPSAKLETYKKCAKALNITLSDIFSDDMTVLERELIAVFRRIPESKHEQLLGLLRLAQEDYPAED